MAEVSGKQAAKAMLQSSSCDSLHRITKSQNGRGWKGPLWII